MYILYHFLASFVACFCFCFLFNVPKNNIFLSAFCGGLSWILLIALENVGVDYIFASLFGSLLVGLLSEFFAILKKTPITGFIVVGTIPLVPGFKVYKTMLFFVTGRLQEGTTEGVQAVFIAISISVGLIISTSIFRFIKIILRQNKNPV